ncbi:hypothetical protein HLB44_16950 [Aquincola sp. S2]|uniref:Uncharacterized protein n=1 Tax=Pseudaquabacterium terrae TaxID=2732868 RepID=A0ABX2EJ57_9BURK|nr:hypothetical protein [Aquabacterium terrae]NRF68682.1 hypothetical protein [Aquabacterium terrae]
MKTSHTLTLLFAAAALLGGCGGDDDYTAPPPPPPAPAPPPPDPLAAVPASATQSIEGLIAYLKTLGMNLNDTREPIDIGATLTLPSSDTSEPSAL